MKLKLFLLFSFLCCFSMAEGQQMVLKRSFPVDVPVAVSADGQGNIYLSERGGEIRKYSAQGNLLNSYSPPSAALFGVLDATSTLQIRAFNENAQTIVYLDRFLNQSGSFELPAEEFNFITALCWSAGNTVWLVDASSMELKKWRPETGEVLSSLKLYQYLPPGGLDIIQIKEHQHKLYLFSPNHLLIFNALGTFEKRLPIPSWKSLAFSENELILLSEDSLSFIHLLSAKEASIPIINGKEYLQLGFSKGELYLFSTERADVYELVP